MDNLGAYALVRIRWVDADYISGWHNTEPKHKPVVCQSVGWLIYDGDEAKVIAGHITEEDDPQRNGEMVIPPCSIIEMEIIKPVDLSS